MYVALDYKDIEGIIKIIEDKPEFKINEYWVNQILVFFYVFTSDKANPYFKNTFPLYSFKWFTGWQAGLVV